MKAIFKGSSCLSKQEIVTYLNNSLAESARYEIENHLLDCPLCNAAVESYASNYQYTEADLTMDIADLEQKIQSPVTSKPVNQPFLLINRIIVIVLLLFLAISAFFYFQQTRKDRWIADFFEPYPSTYLTLRGTSESMASDLKTAMVFYRDKEFLQSVPFFEKYLSENPGDFEAMLFAGIANLFAENPSDAIDYLQRVSINDSKRYEVANWYLALTYLQADKPQEAKLILKGLMKGPEHLFSEKAKVLYSRLPQE